jgi:triacylglycerol lipase
VLGRGAKSKDSGPRYESSVRSRWTALGAASVAFADDDDTGGHAVIAATTSDVFVAFRGTSSTAGWAANAHVAQFKITSGKGGAGPVMQVHGGFLASFAAIYPRVGTEVAKALEGTVADPTAARVFITGHSLGGAHAALAALALAGNGARVGGVWTYAAPKTGDEAFTQEVGGPV